MQELTSEGGAFPGVVCDDEELVVLLAQVTDRRHCSVDGVGVVLLGADWQPSCQSIPNAANERVHACGGCGVIVCVNNGIALAAIVTAKS